MGDDHRLGTVALVLIGRPLLSAFFPCMMLNVCCDSYE